MKLLAPLLLIAILAGCTAATVRPAAVEPDAPSPVQVIREAPAGSVPPPRPLAHVYLKGFQVTTPEVRAAVGEVVTFVDADDVTHQIVSDVGFFRSPEIHPQGSWEHAFNAANTYTFHCEFHPKMTGRVIVSPPS